VTVLAGVIGGLNALAGGPLERAGLVALVTALEGHPDNAAAGILGGFCVARCEPDTGVYVDTVRVAVPAELAFVVVSPAVEILTKAARGALPAQLPFFEAVKSVNSAVYLTAAFATGDYAKLRGAVSDFLHEPYRLPGIPGGRAAIEAGIQAGAFTGWLSGSGSSVLTVCETAVAAAVGGAMQAAFDAVKLPSEVRVLVADNEGLVVEARD
jgi:homoserine kinase